MASFLCQGIRKKTAQKKFIRYRQAAVILQTGIYSLFSISPVLIYFVVMRKWACRKQYEKSIKAEIERRKVQEEVKKKKEEAKRKAEEEVRLKDIKEKQEKEIREREKQERDARDREEKERLETEQREKKEKEDQEKKMKEREARDNRIKQEATRDDELDREMIKKRHYSSRRIALTGSLGDLPNPEEEVSFLGRK